MDTNNSAAQSQDLEIKHSTTSDEKTRREEIIQALKDWEILDFWNQSDIPNALSKPNTRDKKTNDGSKKLSKFEDIRGFQANVSDERSLLNLAIGRMDEEARKLIHRKIIIYVSRVPRDVLSKLLICRIGSELSPVEYSKSEICAAVLTLTDDGQLEEFEFSPGFWACGSNIENKFNNLQSNFEKYQSNLKDRLDTKFSDKPLTISDLHWLIDQIFYDEAYESEFQTYLERYYKFGGMFGKLEQSYNSLKYSFTVKTIASDDVQDEELSRIGLHSFSKDLAQVYSQLQELDNECDISSSSLNLVYNFLRGGVELSIPNDSESSHPAVRLDVFADDSEKLKSFYNEVLGYDNLPYGRWPSKYSPSLMQQVAINLAAGRRRNEWKNNPNLEYLEKDILSVNGPPGTGKTTLLKDIIAAHVVEKARILSSVNEPDELFEKVKLPSGRKRGYLKYARSVYRIKDKYDAINDYGIIVCSSNNAAVENISKELPNGEKFFEGLPGIEKDLFKPETESGDGFLLKWLKGNKNQPKDGYKLYSKYFSPDVANYSPDLYFSYAASMQFLDDVNQISEEYPDLLMSARLGNWSNIGSFIYPSLELVFGSCDTNKSDHEHLRLFQEARARFIKQFTKVESKFKKLDALSKAVEVYQKLILAKNEYIQFQRDFQDCIEGLFNAILKESEDLGIIEPARPKVNSERAIQIFQSKMNAHLQALDNIAPFETEYCRLVNSANEAKGFLRWLKMFVVNSAFKRYQEAKRQVAEQFVCDAEIDLEYLVALCDDYQSCVENHREKLKEKGAEVHNLEQVLKSYERYEIYENDIIRFENSEMLMDEHIASTLTVSSKEILRKQAHRFNPAPEPNNTDTEMESDLSKERDLLFLYALQVTREFILSSNSVRYNLNNLAAMWGRKDVLVEDSAVDSVRVVYEEADRKCLMPYFFQTLNIVTPVISTTFSSVQKMFKDVDINYKEKAPFGTVVIDEAGQATPMSAVGILSRCRKAIIVGDPRQVEPVVTNELEYLRRQFGQQHEYKAFLSASHSVQTFADAVNPIGHAQHVYGQSADAFDWIGCPLVVHRRCESPIFDISNTIAYNGMMINETKRLANDESRNYYLPSSQWINVSGREFSQGNHYVQPQGYKASEIVLHAFEKCDGRLPSLYVISPFKSVINEFENALFTEAKKSCLYNSLLQEFLKNNIGTVHTFQGKEADEVVFLLGCDSSSKGAVNWVNSNIVNVAASRAKHRLYVIGDINVWKINSHVKTMHDILVGYWIKHFEASVELDDPSQKQEELQQAIEALPIAESIPQVDIDYTSQEPEDSDSEVSEGTVQTLDYNQGNARISNEINPTFGEQMELKEQYYYDTESTISAYKDFDFRAALTDDVYRIFGFKSAEDFERYFSDCAPEGSDNLVMANLQIGMFLYTAFNLGKEERAHIDQSFCLIMFCRAAELYLKSKCLPVIKKKNPMGQITRKKQVRNCDELSIRQYATQLNTIIDQISGSETSGLPTSDWWNSYIKNIHKVGDLRNDIAHPGRSGKAPGGSETAQLICLLLREISGKDRAEQNVATQPNLSSKVMRASEVFDRVLNE